MFDKNAMSASSIMINQTTMKNNATKKNNQIIKSLARNKKKNEVV
jgi:hypothetical protein